MNSINLPVRPLHLSVPLLATAGCSITNPAVARTLAFKLQSYAEEDGRIKVDSAYALWDETIGEEWEVAGEVVYNTISGATPTGMLPEDGSDQVPLDELNDERSAIIVNLNRSLGDWQLRLNLNHGEESDYDSNGAAIGFSRELNNKASTVQAAYAFTADRVFPAFFDQKEDKKVHDFIVGVSQVVDRNTLASLNLAYSRNAGYLNDPYKLIQQDLEIFPGFTLPIAYKENRPDKRERWILSGQLNRRFEPLNGTIEAGYRFTRDDWGVNTHTMSLIWFQDLGSRVILQPSIRYLRQSAADFYRVSLNGIDFDPDDIPANAAPHWSSDHRLSEMTTLNLGLKIRFEVLDGLYLDASYERYILEGLDKETPESAYTRANLFTLGGSLTF